MKKLMIIIGALGTVITMSCDNSNRNMDSTQEKHSADTTMQSDDNFDNNTNEEENESGPDGFGKQDRYENDSDDANIDGVGNTSGTYEDGSGQLNYDDSDGNTNDNLTSRGNTGSTSEIDQSSGTNDALPQEIKNTLQNDDAFKNMRLTNSRTYERNGKVYYEITLEEPANNRNLNRSNTTTGDSRSRPINANTD